jgi:RNA 2',3'-cyclic 3'-phosphodiesterase
MKQRLFLAIPLPEALKTRIGEALSKYQNLLAPEQIPFVRFIPPQNWHITIYFFGDVLNDQIDLLRSQLTTLLRQTPSFALVPDSLVLAPPEKRGKNMIWMRYQEHPGLTQLSWDIYEATRSAFRFPPPRPTLVPHVTVVRFKDLRSEILPPLVQPDITDSLSVSHCELWDSRLSGNGVVYSSLERYAFGQINEV